MIENEKKASYPEESVLEVWRYLESSEYGISDMTKEEILDESDDIESVKNIHQRMYEMSIKSGKTTLHLNNGGSENVHR